MRKAIISFTAAIAISFPAFAQIDTSEVILFPSERKAEVSAALILPMTGIEEDTNSQNLDFYCGCLMAAKRLGDEGTDVNLNVFDYSEGISNAGGIEQNNFIIGPVKYIDLLNTLNNLIDSTVVVSPLDHRADSLLPAFPNFIQAAAPVQLQYDEMIQWGRELVGSDTLNFIIVTAENDPISRESALKAAERENVSVKECSCDVSGDLVGWDSAYNPSTANVVILAIAKEGILSNAIRNMGILVKNGNVITMCGSKLQSFENIPVETIHKAEIHCVCPYFIDYNDEQTLEFTRTYRALFNNSPSAFAFSGYDLTYNLIKTYGRSGNNLAEDAAETYCHAPKHGLQSNFCLKRIENGGLVNTAMKRLYYSPSCHLEVVR